MKVAHLTTVDLSLRYLILPQLEAATSIGESWAISAPGPHVAEVESRGIRHISLPSSTRGMDLLADLRTMRELWRVLKELKPDILHTHNPKPGVYGRVLGRLAGVPIVINTVHGLYASPDSSILKRVIVYSLEAIASRFSNVELIQNPEDFELLKRLRIVPAERLRLLGNGVNLDRFNPRSAEKSRKRIRDELGLTDDEVAIGFVGRLVAEKGIDELVAAAEILGSRATVLVAGPDDLSKSDAVTAEVVERGRAAGIRFVGMREDIDAFYGALDVFVLPSYREGFPRAAMEAAASGLPLVVSNIRGCRQVVTDGLNGRLVPVGDAQALALALRELVESEDLRIEMGRASAERAEREFDEDAVVDIVMRTYSEEAYRAGLAWKLPTGPGDFAVRRAFVADAPSIAALHAGSIASGFLSTLGVRFLGYLYSSLIKDDGGMVYVSEVDGTIVGFVAGTTDTGAFYRRFLKERWLGAAVRLAPIVLRPMRWPRVWETVRYGTAEDLDVRAELLSMAVAPHARGRRMGASLVNALTDQAKRDGIEEMRVVVAADNGPAIALYRTSGFSDPRRLEVHSGEDSMELRWRSLPA